MIIKKLRFLLQFLLLIVLITSCSNPGALLIIESNLKAVNQSQPDKTEKIIYKNIILSVREQKTPASLSLNINLIKGFKTKAKTIANDLKSLKFCLLESDTGISPAGQVNLSPLSDLFTYNLGATPTTITFTNLSANNTGKSYYIAVAAYDEVDGTGNNITNNTGNNTDTKRVTISGLSGNFYISSGGGDTSGNNSGSVRVEPITYNVSSTDLLTIQLKLLD